MHQLTLRVPEQLGKSLKDAAAERGESVNSYASAVLTAAVDPDLAGGEAERLRERLARAGLLAERAQAPRARPPEEQVRAARAAAGDGTALADLVGEGRR